MRIIIAVAKKEGMDLEGDGMGRGDRLRFDRIGEKDGRYKLIDWMDQIVEVKDIYHPITIVAVGES